MQVLKQYQHKQRTNHIPQGYQGQYTRELHGKAELDQPHAQIVRLLAVKETQV